MIYHFSWTEKFSASIDRYDEDSYANLTREIKVRKLTSSTEFRARFSPILNSRQDQVHCRLHVHA